MKKNKIMAIILSGAIIITMSGILGQAKENSNKKVISNKINNILLANPNVNHSVNACVVNGNGKLVITNKNGDIVSYLSVGEMLKVQSVEGNKSLVTVQETGARGYINNSNKLEIGKGDINDVTRMNRNGYIINVSNTVNLRKGPSMDYTALEGLSNSTPIRITGKTGQWYRVSVNGKKGYIFEEYVGEKNSSQYTDNTNINSESKGNSINTTNSNINTHTTTGINKAVANHTKNIVDTTSTIKSNSTVHVVNHDKNLNNNNSGVSNDKGVTSTNNNSSDTHIPSNNSGNSGLQNTSGHQTKTPDKSPKPTGKTPGNGSDQKSGKVLHQMNKLPNVQLQEWETGFNTVENKMNASNDQGFLMDIYTPENPAEANPGEANGETVYVRFANTNEICSGQLTSLITPTGGTTSKYGYFYGITLYYKNVYEGTLYYGTNTYGYIQNGGFIPANGEEPINLTLNSGYHLISDMK